MAGAAVCARDGEEPVAGALLGSIAAILAAYAVYRLRGYLGKRLGIPDPLLGVAEDLVVVAAGERLLQD